MAFSAGLPRYLERVLHLRNQSIDGLGIIPLRDGPPGPAVVFATAFSRTFAEAMAESYRFEVGRAL